MPREDIGDAVKRTGFILGLVAGAASALATVSLAFIGPLPGLVPLLLPGLALNLGISGFPSLPFWICPFGNLVFWFLLFWLLGLLIARGIRLRSRSRSV